MVFLIERERNMISSNIIDSISENIGVKNSPFYKYDPIKKAINNFWTYKELRHKDFEILGLYEYIDPNPMSYYEDFIGGTTTKAKVTIMEPRFDKKPSLMVFLGYPTYYLPDYLEETNGTIQSKEDTRKEIPEGRDLLFAEVIHDEAENIWSIVKIVTFYPTMKLNAPDVENKLTRCESLRSFVGMSFKLHIMLNIYQEQHFYQYSSTNSEQLLKNEYKRNDHDFGFVNSHSRN